MRDCKKHSTLFVLWQEMIRSTLAYVHVDPFCANNAFLCNIGPRLMAKQSLLIIGWLLSYTTQSLPQCRETIGLTRGSWSYLAFKFVP